jgi:mono/diheme cytochrome c family protein
VIRASLYILTKSDGMIRKVVGATATTTSASPANMPAPGPGRNVTSQPTASVTNPVRSTPESITAGKRAYDANCAACHGNLAQGAVKAGMTISIIEEQRGKQPPDLTDEQWDHGSSDGEIYAVIKRGVPPTMMPGYDGRIPDDDIWNIVNYLRTLRPRR